MTSSRFREGFNAAIDLIALTVKQELVPRLPEEVGTWYHANRILLSTCDEDLKGSEKDDLLKFFNNKFGQGWIHWCVPGCCASREAFLEHRVCIYLDLFPYRTITSITTLTLTITNFKSQLLGEGPQVFVCRLFIHLSFNDASLYNVFFCWIAVLTLVRCKEDQVLYACTARHFPKRAALVPLETFRIGLSILHTWGSCESVASRCLESCLWQVARGDVGNRKQLGRG